MALYSAGTSAIASGKIQKAGLITGSILQVGSATFTGTQSLSNSTTWTDITNLAVTMTPFSSSSKFLLLATINGIAYDDGGFLRFTGGNSSNVVGDAASTRFRTFSSLKYKVNVIAMHTAIMSYIDSPATTSPITYKVQFASDNDTTWINRSDGDSDGVYYPRGACTFQVFELAP